MRVGNSIPTGQGQGRRVVPAPGLPLTEGEAAWALHSLCGDCAPDRSGGPVRGQVSPILVGRRNRRVRSGLPAAPTVDEQRTGNGDSAVPQRYSAAPAASGSITAMPPGTDRARRMICQTSPPVGTAPLSQSVTRADSTPRRPANSSRDNPASSISRFSRSPKSSGQESGQEPSSLYSSHFPPTLYLLAC